jgi:outer membrane protein assembly factor BamB
MRVLFPVLLLLSAMAQAQSTALKFSDLAGWWSADPEYAGEHSRVVLHLLEEQGKPAARLSIVAIGGYDFPLGTVTVTGDSIDSQPFSFALRYDAARDVLTGYLPEDAVPVYRIPVEFHRSAPYAKPVPPQWQGPRPAVRWSVDTGSPAWAGLERDAGSGLIYVGNDGGMLHAIDAGGAVRWKFAAGKPIKARPAVIGDSVYVASDTGLLYRLDKLTGVERWRVTVDAGSPARIPASEENSRWDRYGSSVVADSRRLYYASRDGRLYAIDIATGSEAWHVAADDLMTATPAIYRDSILFADFAGKVRAVNANDGKLRWTYEAKLPVAGDLVVADDRVLVGSRTYELIALDAATGREQWKHYYWFSWIESPPVVRDGVVYTGSSDATQVFAIDLADGRLRWKTPVPGWAWSRTAVSDDLVVTGTAGVGEYPGARSGSLVALDRRTGALRWLYLDPPSQEIVTA